MLRDVSCYNATRIDAYVITYKFAVLSCIKRLLQQTRNEVVASVLEAATMVIRQIQVFLSVLYLERYTKSTIFPSIYASTIGDCKMYCGQLVKLTHEV